MAVYRSDELLPANKAGIITIDKIEYHVRIDTSSHTNNVTLNGPDGRPVMYYETNTKVWKQSNQNTPDAVVNSVKTGSQLATDVTDLAAKTTWVGIGGTKGGGWAQVELVTNGIGKPGAGTTPEVKAPPTPNLNSQRNSPDTADPGPNSPTSQDTNISAFSKVLEGLQTSPKVAGDYGRWKYPEELNANQDRIYIEQIKYVTPDIAAAGEALAGSLSNRESQFSKEKILGSVTLPMTNKITESVEVGWGESRLSSIAAALMTGGVDAAFSLTQGDFVGGATAGKDTLIQVLKSEGVSDRAAQYLATKAAAEAIGKIGFQINPEEYITRRTGTIPNPNLELLFNGPKLKSFGLSFKLTPRSSDEAHQIRNIIKFFKKGMAPLRGSDQASSFFLGTPNIFRVKFKSAYENENENKNELLSLPQFKTCALVRCEVDYTPDGIYAAYEDSRAGGSQPIAVTLQLGFAELTPIYNNDYELPGGESVGPDRNIFEDEIIKTSQQ